MPTITFTEGFTLHTKEKLQASLGRTVLSTIRATIRHKITSLKTRFAPKHPLTSMNHRFTSTSRDWMRAVLTVSLFLGAASITSLLFAKALVIIATLSPLAAFGFACIMLGTMIWAIELA